MQPPSSNVLNVKFDTIYIQMLEILKSRSRQIVAGEEQVHLPGVCQSANL